MSCAAAAIDRLERLSLVRAAARPLEQAHGRGRRQVQRFRPARLRDAHRTVGLLDHVRREPVGLVPEQEGHRPRQVGAVEVARALGGHREDAESAIADGVDRLGRVDAPDDRQVEVRPRRGSHGLRVVDVDGRRGEDHAAGARGVGRAQHRPGVPRIAHLVQDRETALVRKLAQPHIEEGRRADQPLGRHRGREPGHHIGGHLVDLDAGLASTHRERVEVVGGEQPPQPARLVERLAHRLGALDEEPLVLITERPLLQARGRGHLRVLERCQHGAPRDASAGWAKCTCARGSEQRFGSPFRRPAGRPSPARPER